MRAAAVLTLISLVGITCTISAQDFTTKEDLEYSRGLMKRRMHELAFEVLDRIAKSDASAADKAEANLEIANVYKDQFGRGLTYEERIAASDKADDSYKAFIANFGDHPRIIDAKFEYAEFLVALGRYRIQLYNETLQTGGGRAKAEEHRAKALEKLKGAADVFDELKIILPAQPNEELKERLSPLVEYYRAILYYFSGLAEVDETARLSTFQQAIEELEEYIFANESNLRGFWGYLYKGLCHREFAEESQRADALASFDGVINAFKNTITGGEGAWKSYAEALADPGAKDLFETTYLRYAETLNRFGRYQDAIKQIDDLQKIYKDENLSFRNFGYQALLQQAEAHFLTGNVNKSIGIVSDVSTGAGAGNRLVQFYCDGALAKYLDEVEDKATLDGDVVFKAAKGSYAQNRYHDAMRHFNTVIEIDKNNSKRALECWNYIARCYSRLGFEREAALAASTGAFRLERHDKDLAMDMARKARSSYARIFRGSKAAPDRERLTAHKDEMDRAFGGGGSKNYETGIQKMQEGHYDKSIALLNKVAPDSEKYDLARGYVAFCVSQLTEKTYAKATRGRKSKKQRAAAKAAATKSFEEAIGSVEEYVKFTTEKPIVGNPTKQAARRQALGIAWLAKAAAQKGLEQWNDALQSIEVIEKASGVGADTLEKAAILKAQSYMGKEDWENAEKQIAVLDSTFPGARKNVVSLYGQLGSAWQGKAKQFTKEKQAVPALNALRKSVEFRTKWLKGTSDAKPESLYHLGRDLYELNRFAEAKTYFQQILDKFGEIERPRKKLKNSLRLAELYLGRVLVWEGKYLEAMPIFEKLYNKNKKNLTMLIEYASLLTGTVREVDGKFVYVPGRGAHKDDSIPGYRLWGRVAKHNEKKAGPVPLEKYLRARFHQNLVRWALDQPGNVRKSIKQLKTAIGPNLDRDPKQSRQGYWQRRFAWLERNLNRKAPQTPPGMPKAK